MYVSSPPNSALPHSTPQKEFSNLQSADTGPYCLFGGASAAQGYTTQKEDLLLRLAAAGDLLTKTTSGPNESARSALFQDK